MKLNILIEGVCPQKEASLQFDRAAVKDLSKRDFTKIGRQCLCQLFFSQEQSNEMQPSTIRTKLLMPTQLKVRIAVITETPLLPSLVFGDQQQQEY